MFLDHDHGRLFPVGAGRVRFVHDDRVASQAAIRFGPGETVRRVSRLEADACDRAFVLGAAIRRGTGCGLRAPTTVSP